MSFVDGGYVVAQLSHKIRKGIQSECPLIDKIAAPGMIQKLLCKSH